MNEVDYTYEPPPTPEQERFKADMLEAGRKCAEEVNKHYNEILATMIKLFCEKNKCDISDIAIYHGTSGKEYRFWIGFKKKGDL